jgi:hypothetical protein
LGGVVKKIKADEGLKQNVAKLEKYIEVIYRQKNTLSSSTIKMRAPK